MRDIEARQLGLKMMRDAEKADTVSSELLEQARKESMAFGVKQDSASAGRRAVLAQQAYKHRISAVASRQMAAYALLAADAGDKAVSAKAIARQVTDAQRQKVLIEEAEHATKRRNLMLQAAAATQNALKNVPSLPAEFTGRPVSAQQTTMNGSNTLRSAAYVERAAFFFPSDVRAAAGSFAGVGMQPHTSWFSGLAAALNDCACKCEEQLKENLKGILSSDPAALGADQQADALVTKMKMGGTAKPQPPASFMETVKKNPIPGLAVGLGVAGLAAYLYFRRS